MDLMLPVPSPVPSSHCPAPQPSAFMDPCDAYCMLLYPMSSPKPGLGKHGISQDFLQPTPGRSDELADSFWGTLWNDLQTSQHPTPRDILGCEDIDCRDWGFGGDLVEAPSTSSAATAFGSDPHMHSDPHSDLTPTSFLLSNGDRSGSLESVRSDSMILPIKDALPPTTPSIPPAIPPAIPHPRSRPPKRGMRQPAKPATSKRQCPAALNTTASQLSPEAQLPALLLALPGGTSTPRKDKQPRQPPCIQRISGAAVIRGGRVHVGGARDM